MCGRFTLTATPDEVGAMFALLEVEPFPARYNIAPTQPVLIVAPGPAREPGSNLPDRQGMLVRWGLLPSWAKNPKELPLLINARSETVNEKAAFKAPMRHRRVLVPTTGFYEWRRSGKTRQAFFIRPRSGGIAAFAGLLEHYMEPGGSEMDSCAIVTTAANDDLRSIHDRMPVVIKPEDFSRWLDCRTREPRDVQDLLRPVEPGFFEAIPVSDKVNKVANIGADLIRPVAVVDQPTRAAETSEPEQSQLQLF
ncbi:SOS response-associated peptidase [Tianweitania sediminis]|uniref:Abasic site processing protein n=1 Tax=Tianweitania sediminis TaxID=1502156 RepID=A0A8J7RKL5_9HYPH|nr:SOS response-associated peptidase [Tianweitania sediminis]MBP0438966.1 SOS response-associated peptidase [Tianweitania sediminis]